MLMRKVERHLGIMEEIRLNIDVGVLLIMPFHED